MEKIYMENNNNNKKQSKFMQIMTSKLSNTLSITMILVAFASFLAMGFSGNVSYALVEGTVPDGFTINPKPDIIRAKIGNGTVDKFGVAPMVPTDDAGNVITERVFCLEQDIDFPTTNGCTYKKYGNLDYGFVSILKESYPDGKNVDSISNTTEKDVVGTWVTQVAVWQYAADSGFSGLNKFKNINADIKSVNGLFLVDSTGTTAPVYTNSNFYTSYVSSLVEKAKTYKNQSNHIEIKRDNNDISVTDDNKYYQTSLFTVTGITLDEAKYVGFSLSLKNAPEGIEVIGEDGQQIKDLSNMTNSKFYLRIPINKVTDKKFTLEVNGVFTDAYQAVKYDPYKNDQLVDNIQSVVLLYKGNLVSMATDEVDLTYTPNVPDTGMTSAQSIYFIGLVILICGVGIIYANTKQKQEQ